MIELIKALELIKSEAVSLADAQVIALEALRAALQDKAVEVTVAIDNLYNERRDGMTNAIFPPVQIGTRLFAAQPAPVVPDDHPLMVFVKECRLGAYTDHEVIQEAGKAIAATQQK